MHFSDGEISKLKTKSRRDVGVRVLFVRQSNIEPDRFGIHVSCSAVGRFHNARCSSGDNHVPPVNLAR